jgi:hypothetical protein
MPNIEANNQTTSINQTSAVGQAEAIITAHLHTLWADASAARRVAPIMLWGPPGVGKSSIVRELCQREGIGFIDVRLSQREPVDLRGLPVPDGDQVRWLPNAEWPRDPESKGIILFDEITAADRSCQVAAYEFILDRRLGDSYQVPPGWYVVAAGNRAEDQAVATTMSSALANRFCHIELGVDLESWLSWARPAGVHPNIIGFLRFRPQLLFAMDGDLQRGWPSPRSWERVDEALRIHDRGGYDETCMDLVIQGLIGPGPAAELAAFRSWACQMPDVPAMMQGQVPVSIPKRSDQCFALAAALAYHLRSHAGEADDQVWYDGFLRVSTKLPAAFAAQAFSDIIAEDASGDVVVRLTQSPAFPAWVAQHSAVFEGGAAAAAPAGVA